tara:strand:- start:417 stop:848 length:432 start_codon:yes stop_codon:yes gene_type:complete
MNDSQRERKREYDKQYYQLNKEKKREQSKKWKEENREKYNEKQRGYTKKHYELNKEKRKAVWREHRKKKIAQCVEYLGGKCVGCGTTHNLQFDHIKRDTKDYVITRKITNKFDNLKEELDKCQLLCYTCHLEKTAKEWVDMYN